ncbi:2803_t:CDS:2, partial [Acaulospora colombiana]
MYCCLLELFVPLSNPARIETLFLPSPLTPTSMSDTNAQLNSMPSAETTTSTAPTNTSTGQTSPSSLLPPPESPGSGQEITYFSQNSSNLQTNSYTSHAQASPIPHKSPAGPCYTREELFHLKKSPLVAPPPGMPSRKEWFGEYSEQASKSKDHEGLAATRM